MDRKPDDKKLRHDEIEARRDFLSGRRGEKYFDRPEDFEGFVPGKRERLLWEEEN